MITVENLTKTFPAAGGRNAVALEGVSLEVPEGAICAVTGAAGSGKSALLRCVASLDKPDGGEVRVDGTDLAALSGATLRTARRQIGALDSDPALEAQRTVGGNVALPLETAGASTAQRRNRVTELLDLVGLSGHASAYPHHLTPGQQQRVAVARALAGGPSALLADEPTGELTPEESGSVLSALDRARAELGVTVLIATRESSVVRRVCEDVVVLESGRVVEHGRILDLITEPGSYIGEAVLPASNMPAPRGQHDVVADVVLVGFAAVGALLPEATNHFGVELDILGGGLSRIGETPVARFTVGLAGERSESALKWMVERDAVVRRTPAPCASVAAA